MDKIKLLIADDHAVLKAGLKTLLNSQPDMEVVAEATDGEDAIRKSRDSAPDIVLMDIILPAISGLEATREIKKYNPAMKALVLSIYEEQSYLYEMLRAGADGYVPKRAADTELLAAIRATYRGEHFIHSSMTAGLIKEVRSRQAIGEVKIEDGRKLSEREREVLQLLALGHTNQGIADKMHLSIKTVESYKARLKAKLGLRDRAELVRYAIRLGILDIEA